MLNDPFDIIRQYIAADRADLTIDAEGDVIVIRRGNEVLHLTNAGAEKLHSALGYHLQSEIEA